ncbi:MAG TPA: GNAT family N-acetyltransferase [Chloroflexi bacterium]|jgi:ribosomal protein S18 acetylase RimI-like enzyme|nr:GNAT family N-acetyltransferase [Chloroflexota bacterium]
MVVQLAAEQVPEPIRPFNPTRDMAGLASLIEVAFGPELALTGSRMVQDMRQMALLGPMLSLAGRVASLFSGYVWIEDGRLVGNVTLTQEKDPKVWTISNVAVLPDYRRRGIAAQLMDVAIEHVRRRGGRRILLQVRSNNEGAIRLYRRLGFVTYDVQHELDISSSAWPVSVGPLRPGLRAVRPRDGAGLYNLIVRSTPEEVLARRPIHRGAYRRGLGWRLQQWWHTLMGGQEWFELLAEEEGRPVAYGSVTAYMLRGPHELQTYVLPEHRGHWELPLAEGLFALLRNVPRYAMRSYVSATHPQALEALRLLGFRLLRTLNQMSLDL